MKQRTLTALMLVPVALFALLSKSPLLIGSVALALLLFSLSEYFAMVLRSKLDRFAATLGYGVIFGYLFLRAPSTNHLIWPWSLFLIGCLGLLSDRKQVLFSLLGGLWIFVPIWTILNLHSTLVEADRLVYILFLVLPLWAGDTAAIFVGKKWGRRPLAPTISPNKSMEGALGNLAGCIFTAILLSVYTQTSLAPGLFIGAAAAVFGQVGDLFESALKRRHGVKDSGKLLPGHGGVLDRIDSLLMSALPISTFIQGLLL